MIQAVVVGGKRKREEATTRCGAGELGASRRGTGPFYRDRPGRISLTWPPSCQDYPRSLQPAPTGGPRTPGHRLGLVTRCCSVPLARGLTSHVDLVFEGPVGRSLVAPVLRHLQDDH
jgi:hypothetical protein